MSILMTRAVGGVFAVVFGSVAYVTRRRPLHAVGTTWEAKLEVTTPLPAASVPILEDGGVHACTVRVSRALGTPAGWWDIGGLALRLAKAGPHGGPADVLFASTGTGTLTRHLLRPVRSAAGRPMTTLLPTRVRRHSLLLALWPTSSNDAPREYELAVALDRGPWQHVGLLTLLQEVPEPATRFDPIVNELGGTRAPSWVAALREPAYRRSRHLSARPSKT